MPPPWRRGLPWRRRRSAPTGPRRRGNDRGRDHPEGRTRPRLARRSAADGAPSAADQSVPTTPPTPLLVMAPKAFGAGDTNIAVCEKMAKPTSVGSFGIVSE